MNKTDSVFGAADLKQNSLLIFHFLDPTAHRLISPIERRSASSLAPALRKWMRWRAKRKSSPTHIGAQYVQPHPVRSDGAGNVKHIPISVRDRLSSIHPTL